MSKFKINDVVSFTSNRAKRAGKTLTGVVTKVGALRRGRRRYTVEVEGGQTYTVPEALLSPATLDADTQEALAEEGAVKQAERTAYREERRERRAEVFADRLSAFRVGERVRVFSRGSWQEATVLALVSDAGKIKVTNPANELEERFTVLYGCRPSGKRRQKSITVLANRVRKLS